LGYFTKIFLKSSSYLKATDDLPLKFLAAPLHLCRCTAPQHLVAGYPPATHKLPTGLCTAKKDLTAFLKEEGPPLD
jgi:hypothetical protein